MDVQAVEVGSGCSDRNRNRHVTVNIMRSRCYRGLWVGVVAHIRTRRALGRIILTVNILFGTGIERRTRCSRAVLQIQGGYRNRVIGVCIHGDHRNH